MVPQTGMLDDWFVICGSNLQEALILEAHKNGTRQIYAIASKWILNFHILDYMQMNYRTVPQLLCI